MKEEKSRSKGIGDAGRQWGCDFKQDLPEVTFKQRFTSVREGTLGEKTFQGEQSQHQGPGQSLPGVAEQSKKATRSGEQRLKGRSQTMRSEG